MTDRPPQNRPIPLSYVERGGPRPKSMYDRLGLHFVAGVGLVAVVGSSLTFSTRAARFGHYHMVYSCACFPAMLIQLGLLFMSASIREDMAGYYFQERNGWRTLSVGLLSGVLVFGTRYAAQLLELSDRTALLIVFIPLFILPLIYPFFLVRPSTIDHARRDSGGDGAAGPERS